MPQKPRKSRFGRLTYCTGKRRSIRLRSEAMWTFSRKCISVSPRYQGMCGLAVTTLSPIEGRERDEVQVRNLQPRGERRVVADDLVEDVLAVVHQVHLVDGDDDVPDAEQRDDEAVPLGLRSTPWRASIRMMARSQFEAPVAMFRVYCSWPGQSAMMNLRLLGGKVAVGDVDRDALLALGLQPVGEQRQVELAAVVPLRAESRLIAAS